VILTVAKEGKFLPYEHKSQSFGCKTQFMTLHGAGEIKMNAWQMFIRKGKTSRYEDNVCVVCVCSP